MCGSIYPVFPKISALDNITQLFFLYSSHKVSKSLLMGSIWNLRINCFSDSITIITFTSYLKRKPPTAVSMLLITMGGLEPFTMVLLYHALRKLKQISISQSISKLPKFSAGCSLYQSHFSASSSSSSKRRLLSVTGMTSRMSSCGTDVAAVTA